MPPAFRGYIRGIELRRENVASFGAYPFNIPAIQSLEHLTLDPRVTFLVGENGCGKSTLLEAIAIAAGFNPEGGSRNFNFATRDSHSPLEGYIRLIRNPGRWRDGYFLRAESYFNVATQVDELGPTILEAYGGVSLHEQSHGESFMALMLERMRGKGLCLLDEPEAALSPTRQLAALARIHQLVGLSSQFVIATHSPILLAYPGATIYHLSSEGIGPVAYEETDHFQVTRSFLDPEQRRQMLDILFNPEVHPEAE